MLNEVGGKNLNFVFENDMKLNIQDIPLTFLSSAFSESNLKSIPGHNTANIQITNKRL